MTPPTLLAPASWPADAGPPRCRDGGFATAFVIVLFIALVAVAGLVIDGGGAAATKARAATAAAEAARAGAGAIDVELFRTRDVIQLDPAAAEAAALDWLAATGHTGTASATLTDITVTTEAVYDTQLLSAVGLAAWPVTATATAAPDQGQDLAADPPQLPPAGRGGP